MFAGLDGGPQGIGGGANVGVARAALSAGTSFLGTDFPKVSRIRCLCVAGIDRLATSALLPCNTKRDLEFIEKCLESIVNIIYPSNLLHGQYNLLRVMNRASYPNETTDSQLKITSTNTCY
jgi:hypothetical protein